MIIKNINSIDTYNRIISIYSGILIDVRTIYEYNDVGVAIVPEQNLFLLSWRLLPNMYINTEFHDKFLAHFLDKKQDLFFLCRSGARSLEAAHFALSNNYTNCYNVIDGFEGNNFGLGWKKSNLPWRIL
jgi:rhodanese-related sulfurtransferase